MKIYGLLGRRLDHSYSPAVHAAFGDRSYRLFETDDPLGFLAKGTFDGLNVTIPYKETVAAAVDERDPIAQATGAVNVVVRTGGRLVGYNTDYDGIAATFARHGVVVAGKLAAVVGNGGAAMTAVHYLRNAGATAVDVFCRTPRREGERPLDEAGGDHAVLIQATPVGMVPDIDGMPADPSRFPRLEFAFDCIYNPLRTRLIVTAADRGVRAVGGLYMLVTQAKRSRELFGDVSLPADAVETAYRRLAQKQANLVLVGMPMSGKSMYANLLSERLGRKVVDTDLAIEAKTKMTIPDLFARQGESGFRALEEAIVAELGDVRGAVISTGGGMVKNATAMRRLRQNGVVFFLDRDYRQIMNADFRYRPLIKSPADVERLALERRPLYERYADVRIAADGRHEEVAQEIEAKFDAYFGR